MSDLAKYAQELFKKAGIEGDKAKAVLDALGDETMAKAFSEGFVETPRHHSTLDKTVGEYKGKLTEAEKRAKEVNDWYASNGKPAYDWALANQKKLKDYEDLYGPIESGGDRRAAAQVAGMTQEQVAAFVEQREKQRDVAYVSMAKDIARASGEHLSRFKETLDIDAVEKLALERGLSFGQAYQAMVAPRVEEQRNTEIEARVKAAREEGARDALSKHRLPMDTKPREPHPIFDRKEPAQGVSEFQQDRQSKESFLEGWNNYQEKAS